MTKEKLDSHRLNYLIWRYLVESDYRETAVKLQKEWNIEDPQRLPFAQHVNVNALVRVTNRGLLYDESEREENSKSPNVPVLGYFGPLMPESPAADEEFENHGRKRENDQEDEQQPAQTTPSTHGPANKKPRLSNGTTGGACGSNNSNNNDNHLQQQQQQHHQPGQHGFDLHGDGGGAMDVDDDQATASTAAPPNGHGDENAYPSPEQAATPTNLIGHLNHHNHNNIVSTTNGPTTGTQVDKVLDLNSATTFLDLSDDSAVAALAHGSSSSSNSVLLLQCEFNPRDPTVLAAAGTDALARMWTLARAGDAAALDAREEAASAPDTDSPKKPKFAAHHNLLDESMPSTTTTTGLAWSSDGSTIAVSSEPNDDGVAKVEFWNTDGTQLASYNSFESPIISLKWNLDNSACLAISPANEGASTVITVMYPSSSTHIPYPLPNHSLSDHILDIAWTSSDVFVLCGGDMLRAYQITEGGISPVKKFETREGHSLSKIVYDEKTQLLATASDSGSVDIWDSNGFCHSFNAHQGVITSLAWQPVNDDVMTDDTERLIASAGEDGAISLWNARSTDIKSKYAMTMTSSVVAIAFSPDGTYLAGATNEQILIWKTNGANLPQATWARNDDAGWRTPQTQDSSNDEDQFSLCWDANGRKLAYGVNSKLAIIPFEP